MSQTAMKSVEVNTKPPLDEAATVKRLAFERLNQFENTVSDIANMARLVDIAAEEIFGQDVKDPNLFRIDEKDLAMMTYGIFTIQQMSHRLREQLYGAMDPSKGLESG